MGFETPPITGLGGQAAMGAPNPALRNPSVEPLWQVRVTWPWALSQHAHLPYPSMPSDPLPACSPAFYHHAPWPSPSMLPSLLPACSLAFSHHAPWPSPNCSQPRASELSEFFKGGPFSQRFPSSHRSIGGYLLCFLRPQMWTRSRKRPGPSQPPV